MIFTFFQLGGKNSSRDAAEKSSDDEAKVDTNIRGFEVEEIAASAQHFGPPPKTVLSHMTGSPLKFFNPFPKIL